ncbi:hypothetical protein L1987_41601 [Smallanthus sonchifolius]|uniref:Uncharacterized protein n=1 Tax=Smallanthus sonchifolius TaxID=185202 RepID=A0ACB9GX08_9ASTR|nr:hypothetical protein L1987_41601 [Smallanthus sonchifolius]
MVLRTERCRCPCSSSDQQSYSIYQESCGRIQYGGGHAAPYSQPHQSVWSTGGGYHGNGASHPLGGGAVTTILPNTGPYESYYHGHTAPYSQPHQSVWSTGGGYHGNGASHPLGGGAVTTILPNTGPYESYYHGHNSYGNGTNYGYQKTTWTLKDLDNE